MTVDLPKHRECASQAPLLKLSAADIKLALEGMDDRQLNALLKAAGLRSSRRIIERGVHELVAARLRQLSPSEAHNVASLLMAHVGRRIADLFAKESESVAEEFQHALPAIVASWPASILQLLIVLFWETGIVTAQERQSMLAALYQHSASSSPTNEAGVERRDEASPADLLSPLHRVVATSVAAVATQRPPDEVIAAAVLALHRLKPADSGTWFVLALSRQLAADGFNGMALASPPDECRGAYDLGMLVAAAVSTKSPLPRAAFTNRQAVMLLLTALPLEWDTQRTQLLRSLLEADLAEALSVLTALDGPPRDWRDIAIAIVDAAVESGPQAPRLLGTLEQTLAKWLTGPGATDPSELATTLSSVRLKRARLDRRRGDFGAAIKILERISSGSLEPTERVERERELALAELRLRDPAELGAFLVLDDTDRRRKLARALPAVRSILEWNPMDPLGRLVAGLHSIYEGDYDDVLRQWEGLAEELLDGDHRSTAGPLAFLRGLAALRAFEPALQMSGAADLVLGLDLDYRPPPVLLAEACELLDVHEATDALERVLKLATDLHPGTAFTQLVSRRAAAGHQASESTALELSAMPGLAVDDRFGLLRAALEGATARRDWETIESRLDALEQFIGRTGDAGLDRAWAEVLATNLLVRDVLEPTRADLARVEALRRAGGLDEAREICRALFFRSVSGAIRDIDPHDLLELIIESGAMADEVEDLRRLLREPELSNSQLEAFESVRIVFVGGHEAQERQARQIDGALLQQFGGRVTVDWHVPRWTSNWSETAAAVERSYEHSDALVIMTFVRTLLGRRLRRTAGEAGLPWVSCTGHGVASIERAIKRAAHVVAAQRTGPS